MADVATLEQELTPQLLVTFRDDITHAPIVMLDGNLSEAALQVLLSPKTYWSCTSLCRTQLESRVQTWTLKVII